MVTLADGMGERGSNSFFSLKNLGNLFIWTKKNSTETCFLDFARFSDSQPSIDRGIGALFSFSWKVSFVESSINYELTGKNDRIGMLSLIFVILKTNGIFLFPQFYMFWIN